MSSGPHGYREKDFWRFISYIALYKQMTPWGVVSLDLRDLIGMNYVGDH